MSGLWLPGKILMQLPRWHYGLYCFLVGNLGLQYGAARLPANITAVIMLGEILVAAVSAWWLGSGQIRLQDILGGVLIIAAPWLIRDVRQAAVKNA